MQTEYKEGEPLINDINSFKNLLLSYTESNSSITNSLNTTFDLSDVEGKNKKRSGKVSWLRNNFEDMPLIAAVTILTKIQADVRNAEADVINFLKQNIDATDIKFTDAQAVQIPKIIMFFLEIHLKLMFSLQEKIPLKNQ